MLLYFWLASWIVLYALGHTFAASLDLGIGAFVLVSLIAGLGAVTARVSRKLRS